MTSFLAYFNVTIVACAASFIVGVLFSQKIRDWFHGVPSALRTGLNSVEVAAKAELTKATADVIAKVSPAPAK